MRQLCDEVLTPEILVRFFNINDVKHKLEELFEQSLKPSKLVPITIQMAQKATNDAFWFKRIVKYALEKSIMQPLEFKPYFEAALEIHTNDAYYFQRLAKTALEEDIMQPLELKPYFEAALKKHTNDAYYFPQLEALRDTYTL